VDPEALANSLSRVQGTFISLQRNVFAEDIKQFAQHLNSPVHDASALTDDLEDLLALLSLLDENIGVSNTNMHLRAGLGLGSRVLVQCPGGDWRWGYEGNKSLWFEHSKVYRQHLDGHWEPALHALSQDLTTQYPQKLALPNNAPTSHANHVSAHKVIWLTAGKLEATATGHTSDLASARYRVILPAAELTRMGLNNVFVNESISQAMGGWGSHTPQSGDTLVISKVFTTHALALANDAKNRGANVVVDFCDNFFDHPTRGPLQKALLAVADQVVASTEAMAEVLAAQGKPANAVISDPVELAQGKAKFSPTNTLKLLWFGHAVNIDTLAQCLPQLAELSFAVPLCLTVVTTLPNGADDLAKIVPVGLDVRYTPWSVAATKAAIDDCDLVIIPTIASELKKAKSPNRLLEPLWAGRMVVAGRLPAYLPFGDSAWVGKDIIQGVQWALNNPQAVVKRIQQGQQDIADYFSQTAIANAWMQAIVPKSNAPKSNAPATKAPVLTHMNPQVPSALPQKRLNLGCGDKILPEYINVDVVASRAGKTPDVLCDLHHLSPFEDNTVDEILSVHVVEHFWRWEVLDILKEWVRVLKPGGKMVLECPNLLSACEEFLKNPEAAAFGGPEGQRSMWVFYGDPRWKDPYMVHRWGYTPQSLAKLMQEAGLVNARQMPAQYKLKEPRDMRIEAYKP
jgi:SAM-dependent methyltransferase